MKGNSTCWVADSLCSRRLARARELVQITVTFFLLNRVRPKPQAALHTITVLFVLWVHWNFSAIVETHAATYIVEQAVPAAADTNSGTEAMPLKTVQRAAE